MLGQMGEDVLATAKLYSSGLIHGMDLIKDKYIYAL